MYFEKWSLEVCEKNFKYLLEEALVNYEHVYENDE